MGGGRVLGAPCASTPAAGRKFVEAGEIAPIIKENNIKKTHTMGLINIKASDLGFNFIFLI
jgi:hypothetical protein